MHQVLGKARTVGLWAGRHFRGDDRGRLVQHGSTTEFLRVSKAMPGPLSSAAVWQGWKAMFRHPEMVVPPQVFVTRGELGPQRIPPILSFLTLKVDGGVITQGTEEEGLNISVDGTPAVSGGVGEITIMVDGA